MLASSSRTSRSRSHGRSVTATFNHAANAHATQPDATTTVAERPAIGLLPPWAWLRAPASFQDANPCGMLAVSAHQQFTFTWAISNSHLQSRCKCACNATRRDHHGGPSNTVQGATSHSRYQPTHAPPPSQKIQNVRCLQSSFQSSWLLPSAPPAT